MNRIVSIIALSVSTAACVTISESESFTASGITFVQVDVDKGSVEYSGRSTATDVDVKVTSWARASGRANAQNKQSENSYSVSDADGTLTVTGDTSFHQAGIDIELDGPELIDLNLNSDESGVWVRDVIGHATVTGGAATLSNFEGDVDVDVSRGFTGDIYPFEQGLVDIRSGGSCVVRLPSYAPISLVVEFDPEQESVFTDLGYDDEFLADGLYEAMRVPGDITVNVRCPSGSVEILEHTLSW